MTDFLELYLQDHESGAVAGAARFRRVADTHTVASVRDMVAQLADEDEADHDELLSIMNALDYEPSSAKQLGASIAEKVGSLKPNGHLTDRSPLSDVIDLEGLALGVMTKGLCWELLLQRPVTARAIGVDRLQRLLDRAGDQSDRLNNLRLACVDGVTGDDENPSG